MRLIAILLTSIVLASCSPVEIKSRELSTKYPDSATMGAAEDASKNAFDENSFNK